MYYAIFTAHSLTCHRMKTTGVINPWANSVFYFEYPDVVLVGSLARLTETLNVISHTCAFPTMSKVKAK